MLSIVTPTYNRAEELKRAYNSLKNQTSKAFEWIIVDDGSKDHTAKVVQTFQKEKAFTIKYLKKPNGGKPSAYNKGVENSRYDLLLCLDSDDLLTPEAVQTILADYAEIKNKKDIAGLVYNTRNLQTKELIGTNLPNNVIDTYYNIYAKYQIKGDKLQVIKTKIAKAYPFPIIRNEKFVPEALINNRLSQKYTFLYKDLTLMEKEYLTDGYTNNYFNLVKKNPLSNALYFQELYVLKKSFYNVYGYVLFSIYGKIKFKEILKGHPAKLKILLLYFPTLIISKMR